jgi:hypothetical protein
MDFGSILSSVGDFLGRNREWIRPVVGTTFDLYSSSRQGRQANNYADMVRREEQRAYDDYLRNYGAYTDYLGQVRNAQAANLAARNNAAAANERARLQGVKESKKIWNDRLGQAEDALSPYMQMGLDVMPAVKETYLGGLKNLGTLSNHLFNPQTFNASVAQSTPAFNVNLPVPDYMRMR